MSLHRHCDRCKGHMAPLPPGDLQIIRGKRQGLLGPIPNVLDLCSDCRVALSEWMNADLEAHA